MLVPDTHNPSMNRKKPRRCNAALRSLPLYFHGEELNFIVGAEA
jgi:hypothetical protein